MDLGVFPPYPGDLELLGRFRSERQPFFAVQTVHDPAVILGCGTPAAPDLKLEAVRLDGVQVCRRRGGGGAVVLAPGVIVIGGCFPPVAGRFPDAWSERLARLVRDALASAVSWAPDLPLPAAWPPALLVRGLGDLCLPTPGSRGERKILGSSLYLAKDVVLYQASLLYRADLSLIPRYLGYPSREPLYRTGRSHLDFVANLPVEWQLDPACLSKELNLRLPLLLTG